MSRIVLDASVLLAVLHQEPGSDRFTPDLWADAVTSTVNLAEVQGKLVSRGVAPDDAWEAAFSLLREAVPFSYDHARLAGDLVTKTRSLGLSLGDRACLALAISLKVPVYTTDKSWTSLKLGIRIHSIR
ncbi:MAG TPA: type II toxin-antitoxin system VapC family toxin [Candidatus Acidoferrum sp.]